ncbi:hypothetical protein DEO72_LG2g3827 [Vigna unguiculata]|nr:hypothetical protein DEO72_LG2g3827 [Vigna unguiculata]
MSPSPKQKPWFPSLQVAALALRRQPPRDPTSPSARTTTVTPHLKSRHQLHHMQNLYVMNNTMQQPKQTSMATTPVVFDANLLPQEHTDRGFRQPPLLHLLSRTTTTRQPSPSSHL